MNSNTSIAITFLGFFLWASVASMNGCSDTEDTKQEIAKQKTKQLELQWKIDSLNAMQNKFPYGEMGNNPSPLGEDFS